MVAIFFAGRLSRQSEIDKLKNPSPVRISPQQASSTFQELALRRIARSETKKRLRKDAEAQVIWAKYLNELNLDSSQQIKPNAD